MFSKPEAIYESQHPCRSNQNNEILIRFPGASQLLIKFDKNCHLNQDVHFLRFYSNEGKEGEIASYTEVNLAELRIDDEQV